MPFIGVIADYKDFEWVTKYLKENKDLGKIELILINEKSIGNIKNIKFETIIIHSSFKKMKNKRECIKKILEKAKYLILNADLERGKGLFDDVHCKVITYGFNQKATITISSISEDSLLICLQRDIENITGKVIEPQEFNIKLEGINNRVTYNLLVSYAVKALYKG